MIDSVVTKVLYVGDGQTTVFPFPFPFDDASDVKVRIYNEETQNEQPVTKDFYLDEEAHAVVYPGYAPGQNPPDGSRPPVLGEKQRLAIYRETPVMQLVDLGNKYPMPTIEKLSDKLTMVVQEIEEKLGRCVMSYITDATTAQEIIDQLHADSLNATAQAEAAAKSAAASKYSEIKADRTFGEMQKKASETVAETHGYRNQAEGFAKEAAESAAAAGTVAPAWSATETYSYPQVVAYTDGHTYRCIGENVTGKTPHDTSSWVRCTTDNDDFWEIDMQGNYMPALHPHFSPYYELDGNGDIMPKDV